MNIEDSDYAIIITHDGKLRGVMLSEDPNHKMPPEILRMIQLVYGDELFNQERVLH